MDDRPVTVTCPCCGEPHAVGLVFGGVNVIECPRVPPGRVFALDPATWRVLPDA